MKSADLDRCPRCQGRGKVFSFFPLVSLAVAVAAFAWIYSVFTGMYRHLTRPKDIMGFFAAFVLGPVGLWGFLSQGVISRKGWFTDCPRCGKPRQVDPAADDELPGQMIETSIACPDCGYDLRYQSVSGRCPECGSRVLPPKAMARLSEARKERRSGLIPFGIAAGVAVISLLVALIVSPTLAGCIGVGSLGVLGVLAGAQSVVTKQVDIRGMKLTGWLAVFFAVCAMLFGLILIAVVLGAIFG